ADDLYVRPQNQTSRVTTHAHRALLAAGRRGSESTVSIRIQKPPVPAINLSLISALSFCAGEAGESAPLVLCAFNGRILLANLLQSSSSTFSYVSFPSYFAFQEGIWV